MPKIKKRLTKPNVVSPVTRRRQTFREVPRDEGRESSGVISSQENAETSREASGQRPSRHSGVVTRSKSGSRSTETKLEVNNPRKRRNSLTRNKKKTKAPWDLRIVLRYPPINYEEVSCSDSEAYDNQDDETEEGDVTENQLRGVTENQLRDVTENQLHDVTENQLCDVTENQLRDVTENQLRDVTENQPRDAMELPTQHVNLTQDTEQQNEDFPRTILIVNSSTGIQYIFDQTQTEEGTDVTESQLRDVIEPSAPDGNLNQQNAQRPGLKVRPLEDLQDTCNQTEEDTDVTENQLRDVIEIQYRDVIEPSAPYIYGNLIQDFPILESGDTTLVGLPGIRPVQFFEQNFIALPGPFTAPDYNQDNSYNKLSTPAADFVDSEASTEPASPSGLPDPEDDAMTAENLMQKSAVVDELDRTTHHNVYYDLVQHLQKEKEDNSRELAKSAQENKDLSEKLDKMQNQIDILQSSCENIKVLYATAVKKHKKEAKKLTKELNEEKKEHEKSKESVTQLERTSEKLKEENQILTINLEKEKKLLTEKIQKVTELGEKLNEETLDNEHYITEKDSSIAKKTQEVAELQEKILKIEANKTAEIKEYDEEIVSLKLRIEKLRKDKCDFEKKMQEKYQQKMKCEKEEREKIIKKLEQTSEKLEKENQILIKNKDEAQNINASLEKKYKDAESQNEDLKRKLNAANSDLRAEKVKVRRLEVKYKNINSSYKNTLEKSADENEKKCRTAETQIRDLQRKKNKQESEIKLLKINTTALEEKYKISEKLNNNLLNYLKEKLLSKSKEGDDTTSLFSESQQDTVSVASNYTRFRDVENFVLSTIRVNHQGYSSTSAQASTSQASYSPASFNDPPLSNRCKWCNLSFPGMMLLTEHVILKHPAESKLCMNRQNTQNL